MSEISPLAWYKSSLCSGGDCVEVAVTDDSSANRGAGMDTIFLMRSSKDPSGQILRLTSEEWAGFLADIKKGIVL